MSEKRFIKLKSEWVDINFPIIWDTCNETGLNVEQAVNVLNEQQATITHLEKVNGKNFAERRLLGQDNLILRNENEQLRQQLKEKEEEEQLYADEIVKLNKEVKDNQFLRLGNDY